jgi:hypothetical protein
VWDLLLRAKHLLERAKTFALTRQSHARSGQDRSGARGRISLLVYQAIGLHRIAHPLQLLATCSGIVLTDHEAISGDAPL